MQLRSKYYTYPVISEDGDFYINSSFETDVEKEICGYYLKFFFSVKLVNPQLELMLADGKVMIVHHIECPQTCYRSIIKTNDYMCEKIISDTEVNGVVQICSFLIANEKLEKYCNELFSNDYKGFKFDIDKGCVMAIGNQINFRVNKVRDDLANTASIFSIVPCLDPLITYMQVDISGQKIVISLPEVAFGMYKNMSEMLDMQQAMHSMIIIPALEYVFSELRESRQNLYEYEDRRWYRALCKACEKININISEQYLESVDILYISQLLINNPLTEGLKAFTGMGEYDED